MDVLTPAQRKKNMQRVKSKDTVAEISLRKALWRNGVRYRKNWRELPGSPDIVLTKQKIAIFVDGDFWHGRGHENAPGEQIGTNKTYWRNKIARNIERDKENNDALTDAGWLILRFWESDVKTDLDGCVKKIFDYIIILEHPIDFDMSTLKNTTPDQ